MAKPKPPPIADLPDENSPLDQFLQQAAPILAAQRGINAKSRVLLSAVARDVGLPEDQFDEAIRSLQGAPPISKEQTDPQYEAFCRYLQAKLVKLPRGILTAAIEDRAVKIAKKHFSLPADPARQAIRAVAAACKLHRVSRKQAQQHVEQLVADKLGEGAWLDDDSVARLRSAGREWGLTVEEVDDLLAQRIKANRLRQHKSGKRLTVMLAAGGAALLAAAAFIAIWAITTGGSSTADNDQEEENPPAKQPVDTPPAKVVIEPPAWWDVDLTVAIGNTRRGLADFDATYAGLAADDPTQRGDAYRQVVALCRREGLLEQQREQVGKILMSCYTLDPDDGAAGNLRDELLLVMQVVQDGKLPKRRSSIHRAFWALETALTVLESDRLPQSRGQAMLTDLQRALETSLLLGDDSQPLDRQCQTALTRQLYRKLTALAPKHPKPIYLLYETLKPYAVQSIPRQDRERLDVEFISAALPTAGSDWTLYRELIKDAVYSDEPLNTLKAVRLFERAETEGLRRFLAGELKSKTGIEAVPPLVADAAAAFRKALGVKVDEPPQTASDRWKLLRQSAQASLDASTPDDTAGILRQTVLLAHLTTLGCALSRQEAGFALFDELSKQTPQMLWQGEAKEDEDRDAEDAFDRALRSAPRRPPTDAEQRDLNQYFATLNDFRNRRLTQRLNAIRGLAKLADRFAEITPQQGAAIGRYLTSPEDERELERVLPEVPALAVWKYTRLGLADALEKTKLSRQQVEQLLSAMQGRAVSLPESAWRAAGRDRLLADVLADFRDSPTTTDASDPKAKAWRRAGAALLSSYRIRGRLLGADPDFSASTSPGGVLRLLIERAASQAGAGRTPRDRRFLARLPHELTALEYLADDDPRRTVAMQRIWLRLLAIETARHKPAAAAQAQKLVDDLQRRDTKANDLLVQLRDGEATALRMWLLRAP